MRRFSRRQGLKLMLGACQAAVLGAAGCVQKPATYAGTVTGIAGLVAYWRFADAGGVIDATSGGRHGTYDGQVSLVPGLPANSDAATHLPGNVVGTVPHDPGLLLPSFTLWFWVVLNTVPADPNWFFITKDGSGLIDGDFGVRFTPELELNARFQTAAEGTAPGATFEVQVGTPYHVAITAGAHGVSMWVDGKLIDTDNTYTGGWSENAQPILFAGTQFNAFVADILLDEVALYGRVLADAEIIALSQRTSLPVALPDAGLEVASGATEIFDVVANDSWVGRRADLTIEVTAPATFGAITVRGDKTIEFAAYPVEQTEADSFTYRITDANGQSNLATVSFTVLERAAPPAPGDIAGLNPLCYAESNADTVVVSSMAALETAVNNAPSGRNVLVAPGSYTGGTRTFNTNGAVGNPVVVRPQNGVGTVTIDQATWNMNGNGLVISELYFTRSRINIRGNRNRVTRCRFRQVSTDVIRVVTGLDTRLDHLDVAQFANSTGATVLSYDRIGIRDGTIKRSLMDHIYFHDLIGSSNEIRMIDMARGTEYGQVPEIEMVKCLVDNIDTSGEFIVIKHSRMRMAYCTFLNTRGYLQQRQGSGWEVRSCWFEGTMSSGPLKCWDTGIPGCDPAWRPQLVIGNRLVNHVMWIGAGSVDSCTAGGGNYHASRHGRFIGNDANQFRVGEMWSSQTVVAPALNNILEANIRNGAPATTGNGVVLLNQSGTSIQPTTTEPFEPAVKLTPADVGLAAPDPLCPSGPQS